MMTNISIMTSIRAPIRYGVQPGDVGSWGGAEVGSGAGGTGAGGAGAGGVMAGRSVEGDNRADAGSVADAGAGSAREGDGSRAG